MASPPIPFSRLISLHSSHPSLLDLPGTRPSWRGHRAFALTVPLAWKSLPPHHSHTTTLLIYFKTLFKCYLMCESFLTTPHIVTTPHAHSMYPLLQPIFPTALITICHGMYLLPHLFVCIKYKLQEDRAVLSAVSLVPCV